MTGNGEAWMATAGWVEGLGPGGSWHYPYPPCRSEDWPLPAGREHAKRHLRDLRLVPSGNKAQARVCGCGLGPQGVS